MHMCICTCTVRSNNIIAYSFIEAIKPLDLLMQRKRGITFFFYLKGLQPKLHLFKPKFYKSHLSTPGEQQPTPTPDRA